MNIDKIVKECPRGWEECMMFLRLIEKDSNEIESVDFTPECGTIDISDNGFIWASFHFRSLYDFFDSVGVDILIFKYSHRKLSWCSNLSDRYFKTRTEAEYRAFEKAFEIYEQQLNKEG